MKRLVITVSMFLCVFLVCFAQADLQPLATVKITKAEYENLLEKKKQLEELLKGKKSND